LRHEEIRERILEAVRLTPAASVRDLATDLGLARGTVHYNLQALIREGRVVRHGCPACGSKILEPIGA
jgi:DNA-binding MarR family transcriptional regulator